MAPQCAVKGCDGGDGMAYECNYCGQIVCSSHRLPEKHICISIDDGEKDDQKWFEEKFFYSNLRSDKQLTRSKEEAEEQTSPTRLVADEGDDDAPFSEGEEQTSSASLSDAEADEDAHTDPDQDQLSPLIWAILLGSLIGLLLLVGAYIVLFFF